MKVLRMMAAILVTSLSLAAGGSASLEAAQNDASQKKVLVVYSTRRDTQFSTIGDQTLPRLLERGVGQKIDYYAEYIDAARFPEAEYGTAFRDYLALKYDGTHFDLLVAMNDLALEFAAAHRDTLFPGTPMVFLSENPRVVRLDRSTGIIANRDYRSTLDLARALQPDTKEVFVVVGNSSRDGAAERIVRAQFEPFTDALTFTYLSNLTTEQLERRIATLPEHAIVYYAIFYQDADGTNVNPLEYLDRLTGVANRPVYSWVDSTMNRGVVGGALTSIELRIETVADLALRVLRGEDADGIPLSTTKATVNQVDWRQLQRWHIAESRVPPGTRILFRPPSAWARYKGYIIGATVLLLAQSALIGVLFVQGRRLRRADERLRGAQAELRASYQRIRDLGGRLLTAQDAERSRIALELHDDISQQMAVLSMNLQMLSRVGASRRDDAEAVARAAVARAAVDQVQAVVKSLRDLSHRLYPTKLRLMGLVPAIAALQHDFSRPGLIVGFSHDNVPPGLPHELTLALFRVAQEALRNAVQHSGARQVFVHLERSGEGLAMTIDDDGHGFDVDAAWGRGLGLISMQERLDPIGGTVTIHSTPGAGTCVEISVPAAAVPVSTTIAV
jgi:signal transduction histidine kinase